MTQGSGVVLLETQLVKNHPPRAFQTPRSFLPPAPMPEQPTGPNGSSQQGDVATRVGQQMQQQQ